MASLNNCSFIGAVGGDPEIKTFDNGRVANFRIACNDRYKDRNGAVQESTEWVPVAVGGKLVDVVERYIHKGSTIFLSGKFHTRSYTSRDGEKRYVTEILAGNIQLLDKAQGNRASATSAEDDDDLPF